MVVSWVDHIGTHPYHHLHKVHSEAIGEVREERPRVAFQGVSSSEVDWQCRGLHYRVS